MKRFTIPEWVHYHNNIMNGTDWPSDAVFSGLKQDLQRFKVARPMASIVIPAYNEERDLLKTLSSLSQLRTKFPTDLIVVNNNSTDRTQEIIDRCGIASFFEKNQGISWARQRGVEEAKGKYILCADADTIYPETWADPLLEVLNDKEISCVYGRYSFIPSPGVSRFSLGVHEMMAETLFELRSKNRECVNVMGFNFAFRREDALRVGGFNHHLNRPVTGRSEDGWMALCLMEAGKIHCVKAAEARVWTSDRRLMFDGSFSKAFVKRIKKEIKRIGIYLKPLDNKKEIET